MGGFKVKGLKARLDKFYGISASGSNFRTEIFAGIATFLAMAYILTVNPFMMQGGFMGGSLNRTSALLLATALSSILATLVMSLYAKLPFALAPGMGLNSMVGVIAVAGVGAYAFSYSNLMVIILLSGIVFWLVSFIPVGIDKESKKVITLREKLFDCIPPTLKIAIPAGIGLFIAFVGLQNAGVIIADGGTIVGLVKFDAQSWTMGGPAMQALVCFVGVMLIAILSHFKVKGAILFGMLGATIFAIPLQVAELSILKGESVSWAFWESFGKFFSMDNAEGSFGLLFKGGFDFPTGSILTVIVLIISFGVIDLFDTIGTVIGCSAGHDSLLDESGHKPKNYNKMMLVDSSSSIVGAIFGTSTVTTFVESSTGIEAGGRTGMTSLVVTLLFVLSIFILPVFAFIPSAAAASALIYVGTLMMHGVGKIDFLNARTAIPAFVTIIAMPLTYSITDGLGLGIILYVIITAVCKLVELIQAKSKKSPQLETTINSDGSISTDGTVDMTTSDTALIDTHSEQKNKNKTKEPEMNIITIAVASLFLVYFLIKDRV